ncbi:hypothetical protein BH23VER1_BH23VER1_32290 [soil metagenome]
MSPPKPLLAALCLAPWLAVIVATPASGDAFNPKRYELERYSKLWDKSPFEFEIIIEEEVVEEENPFEDLRLAGFTARGDVYSVILYDSKNPTDPRIRLKSGEETDDGIKLVKVERGETFRDTEVFLQKGDQVGSVGYDEQKVSTAATGAVGMAPQSAAQPQRLTRAQQIQAQREQQQLQAQAQAAAQAGQAQPGEQPQPGQPGQPRTQGEQAASQEARNEVIQRLLERAKQNQAPGGGAPNAGQPGQPAGGGGRRPRVILPPSR